MRKAAIAALALFAASSATAQTAPQRPETTPPAATAAFELREQWCQRYAEWYVSRLPAQPALPADVRPTHLIEVELNYCILDPQQYERQTLAELQNAAARA
jgi:hypothetical protein